MLKIKVSDMLGKHKMTQKQLMELTGIRPGTISAYYHETVKRIEIEHLQKLCEVFQCQPGDLLQYIPDKSEMEDPLEQSRGIFQK